MTDLKTRIARGEYEIDSRAVAETIIAKLQTVSRVRAQLDRQAPSRPERASRRRAASVIPAQR